MTEHTVSWSEIDTFRQCPFKHRLSYKDRWTKPSEPGTPLSRGSLWHLVLETHYRGIQIKMSPEDIFDSIIKILQSHAMMGDEHAAEAELVEWMYQGYVSQWGMDEDWRILAVEYANEFYLPDADYQQSPYKVKVKIDLVVETRATKRIWIIDHKSVRDLPTERMVELDDQFGLYTWGLRILGKQIHGAIYNSARTLRYKDPTKPQPLEERFSRRLLYRTDRELETIALEAYRSAHRAWSTPYGTEERTPDTDRCRWKCNFTEPCLASRKGVDHVDMLEQAGFTQERERH